MNHPGQGRTAMAQDSPLYRLVVFDESDDSQGVRDLFCRVTGIHPTDAAQWLARVPGVYPKPLPAAQVRPLLDGLYEFGIAAEAWRTDQFPDLSKPRTIHDAACLPDGFRVKGLRGEPTHWAPWEKVELINAGRISVEDEFKGPSPPSWTSALTMGLQALTRRGARLPSRGARAQRIIRDPIGEVILIRRDPLLAFRIVENQMNYAYLGARLSVVAAENFPVFVADLCARADHATITAPTRALVQRLDPENHEFPSSQALLEDSLLQLLWRWYRRDRDQQERTMT